MLRRAAALALLALAGCPGDGGAPDPGPTHPPASAGHDLVFHDQLGVVLLVNAGLGGATSPPSSEPTRLWAWDGERWTVLDDRGPPIRNLGGVAYDAGREVLVLHGGTYSDGLSYGDTWEWSPAAGWREVDVPGPGVRDHTQMAFDATRGVAVLHGGQSDPETFPVETWTFDGGPWTKDEGSGPGARIHHAMGWDASSGEVVLLGGLAPGDGDRGDTWAWDGGAWEERPPGHAARTHGRMAYDENLDGLVLVGGFGAGSVALLRVEGVWHDLDAPGGPGARYLPGVAFDRRRGRLVVFGGGDPASDRVLDDLWEFDGVSWTRR